MDRVKLAGGIVAAVLALIVIAQNWKGTEIFFLFGHVTWPLSVVLLLTFLLGGGSGWLLSWWRSGRR